LAGNDFLLFLKLFAPFIIINQVEGLYKKGQDFSQQTVSAGLW